jgi:hypothetical protein
MVVIDGYSPTPVPNSPVERAARLTPFGKGQKKPPDRVFPSREVTSRGFHMNRYLVKIVCIDIKVMIILNAVVTIGATWLK